jgi:hypothetical protein
MRPRGEKNARKDRKLAEEMLQRQQLVDEQHKQPADETSKVGAGCLNRARPVLCGGAQQWASLPRSVIP